MNHLKILFSLSILLSTLFGILNFSQNDVFAATTQNEVLPKNRILIKFKSNVPTLEQTKAFEKINGKLEKKLNKLKVDVIEINPAQTEAILSALRKNPLIEYAEIDEVAVGSQVPNDQYYSYQYGLEKIGAPAAWDVTHGSPSAVIAILDSGIDSLQPDLGSVVINKANFTTDNTVEDNQGHGTSVAGVAAAITNNGIGVAGMSYSSNVISGKVLDSTNNGYVSWVAEGIVWATDNGAKVINLSLGFTANTQTLQDAVNYAQSRGVVVVAAAGNLNNTTPLYPANYADVVSVAATDQNDNKTSISSYGTWVDVAAPGVDILSTCRDGWYCYGQGTSIATPFVSGLAALLIGQNPSITNTEVVNRIQSTADPIIGTGTYWRHGRINAARAVAVAPTVTPTSTPTPTLTPTQTPMPTITPTPSAGTGLSAQYFDNSNFTTLKLTRIDPQVNFNWGSGSPATSIGRDTFSVRWTGKVMPQYTQTYTFYVRANDGVRLWINNQQIINRWSNQWFTREWSGQINLTAGQKYDIRLEYYENTGSAEVQLLWQSPSQQKQLIPTTRLFPN